MTTLTRKWKRRKNYPDLIRPLRAVVRSLKLAGCPPSSPLAYERKNRFRVVPCNPPGYSHLNVHLLFEVPFPRVIIPGGSWWVGTLHPINLSTRFLFQLNLLCLLLKNGKTKDVSGQFRTETQSGPGPLTNERYDTSCGYLHRVKGSLETRL